MRLILASGSPRRKELLQKAGYEFEIDIPDDSAESAGDLHLGAIDLVALLAFKKAENVAQRTQEGLVLAADTVAECQGSILGKPRDREHAANMLHQMKGQDHFVHTGVCLWHRPSNRKSLQTESTTLRMAALTESEISTYLDSGMWQGKAGAFGYQDSLDWVQIIHGSPSNVVGLPMDLMASMLKLEWTVS